MSTAKKTAEAVPEELVADLLAEEVRALRGAVGVLVQDVPHLTPEPVLERLQLLLEEGEDLRIVSLAPVAADAGRRVGLDVVVFATEVEQAERWRNERGLTATIVVIASGDEARLSSLHEFEQIGPAQLKERLARRASGRFGETNEVQGRWWELLKADPRVSFQELLDYFCALDVLEPADVVARASREMHRLGLLPDPAIFDNPRETTIRRRLELNRELVSRLQTLTAKDRGAIAANISAELEAERKTELNRAMRLLRQARRGERGMEELTLTDAQSLFGLRSPRTTELSPENGEAATPRSRARPIGELAAEALLDESDAADAELTQVLEDVVEQLNALEEPRLRPERLAVELPSGITVQGQARADLVNLMGRLLGEELYGGWLVVEGEDVEEMLRRFHGDQDVRTRFTRREIDEYIANFDHEAAAELADLFATYNERRQGVLPYVRMLCAEPLAVAAASAARAVLLDYIASYRALFERLASAYEPLFTEFGSEVDGLLAKFLSLELVVFGSGERSFALLAPTHPLFLWHYAEYCRIVEEQRASLSERDRRLVADAARDLPNFLSSLCVPPIGSEQTQTLAQVSRIGPLPYYGPTPERGAGDDGAGANALLIRAFIDLYPPARDGLRLTLLDPPDAGIYLSLIADLAEAGALNGAHVTVLRHPRERLGTELRLPADEEDRVARIFRGTSAERRFTFEVRPIASGTLAPPAGLASHLLVVFDQTPGRQDRIRVIEHPIQPLALTQRLQYRAQAKTVDLVPAPGGIFASYFGVAERLARGAPASHFAVNQAEEIRRLFAAVADESEWLVIADRRVDRDLSAGELRIFTGQDGSRDVAGFARSSDPFRRAIRDVARQYNTAITDTELDGLLTELSDLLDGGVVSLRPGADGRINHAHVKGLLGTLIAARWYRSSCPEGCERLLLSLDDPVARRWLHLREDALRADLVGVETGPGYCSVTILEVKALDSPQGEYQIADGVASGPAVDQLLSTRRLLEEVFAGERADELITTPARREILREHAFRELTKARYTPEQRREWVEVLEDIFAGTLTPSLHAGLVEVQLGVDAGSLGQPRTVRARQGEEMIPLAIVRLNEAEVEALRARLPDQEPPDGSAGEPASRPEPPSPTRPPAEEVTPPTEEQAAVPPTAEAAVSPVAEHAGAVEAARPRAYLGEAPGTYGKPREVWFDPALPDQPLPNPHVSITGETGSGKTQATKAILHELLPGGLPVLILDFKDDYSTEAYIEAEGLTLYDASYGGLPFNPMVPPVDSRSGKASPINHIHQLSEILKRVYRLGDQQAFHLREAMKEVYEIQGLDVQPAVHPEEQSYLPFDAVREVLVREGHGALLGRLSPIFDLGLFASESDPASLESLLSSPAVIRLSQLPGDEVKNAVAEFLLLALYNHLIRQSQPRGLRRVVVLDEAWRLVESPVLEPLMREGRAFGLSVVVATQFPKDLPDAVLGSTNTKLYFSQTQSDQIREIQRTVVGKTTGAEAEHVASAIRGMRPLTCLLQNAQHSPYVRVEVKPYYERVSG